MATVDRVFGDYYLKSLNGNIYIDAQSGNGVTTIHGNLLVIGKQTNIGSIETIVSDNIITLAANVTSGEPVLNAGIEVRRGDEPTVSLRWNEEVDRWQVTSDGSFFSNIMIKVEDDPDPHLGGHLNVNGYNIRSRPNENIVFEPGFDFDGVRGGLQLAIVQNNVIAVPDAVIITAKEPNNGKTGLYVTNTVSDNEELITKRKAVVYSLVL